MPVNVARTNAPETPAKPNKLDELFRICEVLSRGFSLVRIDFYYLNDRIYFGEMTFTDGNGINKFIPREENVHWGDLLTLPM